jgi:hypothetical protein
MFLNKKIIGKIQILLITFQFINTIFIYGISSNQLSHFNSLLNNLNAKYILLSPVSKKPKFKQGQTTAYLSIPSLAQKVKDCYQGGTGICPVGFAWKNVLINNPEIKKIVDSVIKKEERYKNTHFVFYHAHKSLLRILLDFNTQMCILDGQCDPNHPFIVLRNFGGKDKKVTINGKIYNYFSLPDLNTWMDQKQKEVTAKGQWITFDAEEEIKAFLLPLNLSLYGSIHNKWEHTFHYFLNSLSFKPPDIWAALNDLVKNWIKDSVKREKYVNELEALTEPDPTRATLFNNKDRGDLIQIFIPINLVDKLIYLSKPWGTFWFDYINKTDTHQIYDTTRKRYTAISPILKIYVNDPEPGKKHRFAIDYQDTAHSINPTQLMDAFQARLLLRGEYFADTSLSKPKNIRIYRYSTMKKDEEQKYLAKLKDICSRIFAEKDV